MVCGVSDQTNYSNVLQSLTLGEFLGEADFVW